MFVYRLVTTQKWKVTLYNDESGKTLDEYEKLVCNRNEVIKLFEKTISMEKHLAESDLYLYHCGI
ncbi:hypothetical protein [Peribacillus loiseleuriae]|uniref:hypothetical protein n=1 Tax=Peribacillus loiseleuriae TaxID=1679170 RepID=UPI003D0579F3